MDKANWGAIQREAAQKAHEAEVAALRQQLSHATAQIERLEKAKRAKVIDKLLNSQGYRSHLFNYLADMLRVAVASGAGMCAMHMQGTPRTMQADPRYGDVVAEIHEYLARRRDALLAAGVVADRICLDPGIGFGKTREHNLELMARAAAFLDLGAPILVGHSRKGFLTKMLASSLGRDPTEAERDAATADAACHLAAAGIQIVRVHAVATVRAALDALTASRE